MFGATPAKLPDDSPFTPDIDLETYIAKYEPDLSVSTVRQRCADGWFPDTVLPDGNVVPGAYRNRNGHWRVTLAGITEAQRLDREANRAPSISAGAEFPLKPVRTHAIPDERCASESSGGPQRFAVEPEAKAEQCTESPSRPKSAKARSPKGGGNGNRTSSPAGASKRPGQGVGEERRWRVIRGVPS